MQTFNGKWYKRHKKSILGAGGLIFIRFLEWFSSISDLQERFFPLHFSKGVTMPHFNLNWIFWLLSFVVLGLIYRSEQKRNRQFGLSGLLVELDGDVPALPAITKQQVSIFVSNKLKKAVQNVKVEILGISPMPRSFKNPKFPINLPSVDAAHVVNPESKLYFDLLTLELEPESRRATFTDESGNKQSFEDTMYDMLDSVSSEIFSREYHRQNPKIQSSPTDNAYLLEVKISALDQSMIKKQIRLKFIPRAADILNITPQAGFLISIV